jgi:hypothetical protein
MRNFSRRWRLYGNAVVHKEFAHWLWRRVWLDDIPGRAAQLSYYFLLSLSVRAFPPRPPTSTSPSEHPASNATVTESLQKSLQSPPSPSQAGSARRAFFTHPSLSTPL